jgi:hypothetical protein
MVLVWKLVPPLIAEESFFLPAHSENNSSYLIRGAVASNEVTPIKHVSQWASHCINFIGDLYNIETFEMEEQAGLNPSPGGGGRGGGSDGSGGSLLGVGPICDKWVCLLPFKTRRGPPPPAHFLTHKASQERQKPLVSCLLLTSQCIWDSSLPLP